MFRAFAKVFDLILFSADCKVIRARISSPARRNGRWSCLVGAYPRRKKEGLHEGEIGLENKESPSKDGFFERNSENLWIRHRIKKLHA